MREYDQRLHNLLNGDPNAFEYHQDYREGIYSPFARLGPGAIITVLCLLIPAIYHGLYRYDFNLLPLHELLWNVFVYLTPSRLLDAIEAYRNPLRIRDPALRSIPKTHAAKSESMRRLFGLDTPGGILDTVAQAGRRRLSSISGINIVSGSEGKPAGLGNWDNSCYQNSVLQGLASLDSLSEYLTNPNLEDLVDGAKPDMKMVDALRGLIETLNDPESDGRRIWTPATLKNMSSWQQQDAQEYFSKVLDEVDKEIAKAATAMRNLEGLESRRAFDSNSSQTSSSPSTPMSNFRNPLEGLTAQRVVCTKCGYSEGLRMIPFNCLTVPLGRAWEYDISECLDEYTNLEPIEGVECGKCTLLKNQRLLGIMLERTSDSPDSLIHQQSKERLEQVQEALEEDDFEEKTLTQKCKIPPKSRVSSTKSKQSAVARPPRSLVLHVNRSLYDGLTGQLNKNYSEVRFPKILDLGPWCLGSAGLTEDNDTEEWLLSPERSMIASSAGSSRIRGPIYELRAAVTHYGRHENGHYICYRKHPTLEGEGKVLRDQWWRLSDDDVTRVSEENVLGQGGVFMLFYDLIEQAGPMFSEIPQAPATNVENMVEASSRKLQELEALEAKARIRQPLDSEELAKAVNVPLPDMDDTDFSDLEDTESHGTRGESIATTVSDDEDAVDETDASYVPTKPIVIPHYIPQTGGRKDPDGTVSSPGPLVMV